MMCWVLKGDFTQVSENQTKILSQVFIPEVLASLLRGHHNNTMEAKCFACVLAAEA